MLGCCVHNSVVITVPVVVLAPAPAAELAPLAEEGAPTEAPTAAETATLSSPVDTAVCIENTEVNLQLEETYLCTRSRGGKYEGLCRRTVTGYPEVIARMPTDAAQQLPTRVSKQLEVVLHTACKLDLPILLNTVVHLLRNNSGTAGSF